MSSQEAVHVSLIKVTPRSGKETLGTWWCHRQRGGRTQSRHKPTQELALSCGQTTHRRGVCAPALEPRGEWEGSRTRGQDFKPDLGNSAVRHYRGAFENVAMGARLVERLVKPRSLRQLVGIELRRAGCRWRVTKPALSIASWDLISTMNFVCFPLFEG